MLVTDCAGNLGQLLPSVPSPVSLPHSVKDEGHRFDLQAPGYCQLFGHSLKRSPQTITALRLKHFASDFACKLILYVDRVNICPLAPPAS